MTGSGRWVAWFAAAAVIGFAVFVVVIRPSAFPDAGDPAGLVIGLAEAEGIDADHVIVVTDNLVDGEIVAPLRVVRRDEDDPYLVVAADKGTATFSDIANGVAAEHGHWLGDAFASGGSEGYDHKALGITAKGAWESVRRHFVDMSIDVDNHPVTVVGIGDMSGDVFGNGMLRTPHMRVVAAFDHRDIFIDPQPDAATGFEERSRLFTTPRSSWQDYDTSLISEGGGVFARTLKSIELSSEARAARPVNRRSKIRGQASRGALRNGQWQPSMPGTTGRVTSGNPRRAPSTANR